MTQRRKRVERELLEPAAVEEKKQKIKHYLQLVKMYHRVQVDFLWCWGCCGSFGGWEEMGVGGGGPEGWGQS